MASGNISAPDSRLRGLQLLEISRVTEGTAFTEAERSSLGLVSKIVALSNAPPAQARAEPRPADRRIGNYLSGLFPLAKYASGVAKQCFETVVHVLLDVAVKQG
jgi:hypothetical protein